MKEKKNHFMGKHTGCTLINGEYHLAPVYQDQFSAITNEKVGLDSLLVSVNSYASKEFANINKKKDHLFKIISEDLGIDTSGYEYSGGVLRPIKKESRELKK